MPSDNRNTRVQDLTGKTIVITGASSGLGRAAAIDLASRGAELAVVGRNAERTNAVASAVSGIPFLADYDRLDDVRALADALQARFGHIDVLANNAGGLVRRRAITVDGFERTLQANHLAQFLLTMRLLPLLKASRTRVISTASVANLGGSLDLDDLNFEKRAWIGGWRAYGTSKLETILFIAELARRTSIEAYSFHPGYVSTNFGAETGIIRFTNAVTGARIGLSPTQGAAPLIHLAAVSDVGVPSGTYFDRLTPHGKVHKLRDHARMAEELWERSASLVGIGA